jgi:hypothetical protein
MAPEVNTLEVQPAAELRTSLYELGNHLRELRTKPKDQRSDKWTQEMRDSAHLVYSLDAELRVAEQREVDSWNLAALTLRQQAQERKGAGAQGTGAGISGSGIYHRSMGQQVVENERFKEWRERGNGSGTSPDIEVRAPSVIAGDPFLIGEGTYLDPNGSAGLWVPRGTPYLPSSAIDQRRLFMRDLLATGTTELAAIPYIRELNPRVYEEGATSVAEGTPKPEVQVLFTQDLAPVRKIGAWVPVTTEILEDAPTLQSYINARLGYMIRVREEEQLLNGTGNGADIRGITNTPNIQTQTAVSGDHAATIGLAIGLIESVDGDADGVAMNPLDYWTMVTTRHAQWLDGSPVATGPGSPYGDAPKTVWGMPAVRSRSIAVGQALVGSFKTGAQLFDRSAASIRVGDQHADYFTNNKVAVLIEERLALAVYRPDWFVLATL